MTTSELNLEQEAADAFVERLHGDWTARKQAALDLRLESEPAFADAYRRVAESWATLDTHAEVPELIACREEAIAYARRAKRRGSLKPNLYQSGRWRMAAAVAAAIVTLAIAWQLTPYGYIPGR